MHRRAIQHLIDEGELATEGDDGRKLPETSVDFLSLDPLLVAVNDGSSFGLLGHKRTSKLKCLICSSHCDHLHYFHEWCEENNAPIELHQDLSSTGSAAPDYSILSKRDIPYPLPEPLKLLHDRHERGQQEFPLQLIPHVEEGCMCTHGNLWDCSDPISNKWIAHKGVKIYKESITIYDSQQTVYYRPTTGECDCKLFYDGQTDLLLNLDNKHMFYYGFLFQYLHN